MDESNDESNSETNGAPAGAPVPKLGSKPVPVKANYKPLNPLDKTASFKPRGAERTVNIVHSTEPWYPCDLTPNEYAKWQRDEASKARKQESQSEWRAKQLAQEEAAELRRLERERKKEAAKEARRQELHDLAVARQLALDEAAQQRQLAREAEAQRRHEAWLAVRAAEQLKREERERELARMREERFRAKAELQRELALKRLEFEQEQAKERAAAKAAAKAERQAALEERELQKLRDQAEAKRQREQAREAAAERWRVEQAQQAQERTEKREAEKLEQQRKREADTAAWREAQAKQQQEQAAERARVKAEAKAARQLELAAARERQLQEQEQAKLEKQRKREADIAAWRETQKKPEVFDENTFVGPVQTIELRSPVKPILPARSPASVPVWRPSTWIEGEQQSETRVNASVTDDLKLAVITQMEAAEGAAPEPQGLTRRVARQLFPDEEQAERLVRLERACRGLWMSFIDRVLREGRPMSLGARNEHMRAWIAANEELCAGVARAPLHAQAFNAGHFLKLQRLHKGVGVHWYQEHHPGVMLWIPTLNKALRDDAVRVAGIGWIRAEEAPVGRGGSLRLWSFDLQTWWAELTETK